MVFLYVITAIFLYLLIYFKTKDKLNPLSLGGVIWLLSAAAASYTPLYDHSLQNELAFETHLAIYLTAVFFVMPAMVSKKDYIKKLNSNWERSHIYFTKSYYLLINSIAILSIVVFLIRFAEILAVPSLLAMSDASDMKQGLPPGLPVLHYFDHLTPYIALVFLFEIKMNDFIANRRRILLWLYIFFSIATIFLYKVSRDDLLILLSGWLCISYYSSVAKGETVKFASVAISVLVLSIIIIFLGLMRMSDESRVSTHFDSTNLVFLSQIYTYVAFGFQNLNSLVVSDVDYTYVWAVWRFILNYFYAGDYKQSFDIVDFEVIFFNSKTLIYYFYHDLGLFGVALYSFVIGFFVQLVYGAMYRDFRFLLMLSFLMKPILFMFFGNFFFIEFVLFFPYAFSFLVLFYIKVIPRNRGESLHVS